MKIRRWQRVDPEMGDGPCKSLDDDESRGNDNNNNNKKNGSWRHCTRLQYQKAKNSSKQAISTQKCRFLSIGVASVPPLPISESFFILNLEIMF